MLEALEVVWKVFAICVGAGLFGFFASPWLWPRGGNSDAGTSGASGDHWSK